MPQLHDEEIFINTGALAKLTGIPDYLRNAAKKQVAVGMFAPGAYVASATEDELDGIIEDCSIAISDTCAQGYLGLLVIVLLNAEGKALAMSADTTVYVRRLLMLCQVEKYRRAGMLSLDYARVSLESFSPEQAVLTEKAKALGAVMRVELKK